MNSVEKQLVSMFSGNRAPVFFGGGDWVCFSEPSVIFTGDSTEIPAIEEKLI